MTSVARRREENDSGEYSDASQDNDQNNTGNEGGAPESDYDSRGSESDLSDRDQDSQETERRVDDDEDRSNPQYIPKRGTFYEHDDRTADTGEEGSNNTTSEIATEKKETATETPGERRRPPRKSEIIDKWSHDKYNENEQIPKTREELVAIYGYDIRNEDAPPHARRNRRYGRGPNKYTRTWEDEEAYKRQINAAQTRVNKPPNPEDFPELDPGRRMSKKRVPRPRSKSQPPSNESSESGSTLRRNASTKAPKANPKPPFKVNNVNVKNKPVNVRVKEEKNKMPALENLTITTVVNNNSGQPQRKVNTTPVAQQRPVPTVQSKKPPPPVQQPQIQQNNNNNNNASQQQQKQQVASLQQQAAMQTQQRREEPLTQNAEPRGSKRYSSLRQRPLAEPYAPQPPPPPPHRYHSDYTGGNPAQLASQHQPSQLQPNQLQSAQLQTAQLQSAPLQPAQSPQMMQAQQQMLHQQQVHRSGGVNQSAHGPSPPHQNIPQTQHNQQVRLGMMEQQQQQQLVSHPHHALHNIAQQHSMAGQMPPQQAYAPPAMMSAQFMQGSNNAVYAGPAMYAPPAAPYPHQLYQQHYVPQATQAGGVTYYSAEQEPPPPPRRRPTAAIPIVPPARRDRQPNSAEKDNIDRIVENMFVRKPYPATHGTDSKEKPQGEVKNLQESSSAKDPSQASSLTSSSISNESRPSAERTDPETKTEDQKPKNEEPISLESTRSTEQQQSSDETQVVEESIATNDA